MTKKSKTKKLTNKQLLDLYYGVDNEGLDYYMRKDTDDLSDIAILTGIPLEEINKALDVYSKIEEAINNIDVEKLEESL